MLASSTLKVVRLIARSPLGATRLKQVQVIHTTIPTVFTQEGLDPDLPLSKWSAVSKELFGAYTCYLHPADLKYQYPTDGVPEFAFVGRSNVGKSSLVDLLLGNKRMVRVSKEPGCTRSINYYGIKKESNSSNFMAYFVDLPGYGFARKSKEEQQKWTEIIHSYVSTRDQRVLRRVFVLVDIRRGIKEVDVEMMITLNNAHIPYQIVLTKADTVTTAELYLTVQSVFQVIASKYGATCLPFVHTISSLKKTGIDVLKLAIAEVYAQRYTGGHTVPLTLESLGDNTSVDGEGSRGQP